MKLAIVRVRGNFDLRSDVRDTLVMLGLKQKNHCAVVDDSPIIQGMIRKVSPFITWGPLDEKTALQLKKKGEDVFRLNPPRKGYGRKGIKVPFARGGAVGNRKEKINDLLSRMV